MNRHLSPAEREAMVRQQARDYVETPIEKVLWKTTEMQIRGHYGTYKVDIYLARVRFLECAS